MKTHAFKNLVLVSFDTTRADVAYSGKFPTLQKLREHAAVFKNCVASSPLTPPSHASVFTGLHPFRHGIRHLFRERLGPYSTLAEVLKAQGFSTSAVVSCPGLNSWYDISRGFDTYDDEIPLLPDGSNPLHTVDVKLRGQALKRAPVVVERSMRMLSAQRGGPFLHFLHFFDAHWPYEPPEQRHSGSVANPYEAEIAFVDYYFGRWLQWFEDSDLAHDTLIVIFGDHGEDLNGWYSNDKGGAELNHPEEMGHGCLLYDQTIMVPLMFYHPALKAAELEQQVRLVDVMPTCLELLGRPIPGGLDGISLVKAISGDAPVPKVAAYSETYYPREQVEATGQFEWTRNKKCVRIDNRYKVIVHIDSDQIEVFDLANDPLEKTNILEHRGESA